MKHPHVTLTLTNTARTMTSPQPQYYQSNQISVNVYADGRVRVLRITDVKGKTLLTPREEEISMLVAEGMTNREVSRTLKISESTVKNSLFHVFEKLGISNRVELAQYMSVASAPDEDDYVRKGGHFGPHNIHENRPGSFVSSELIFATYQNAGVRIFDISDQYRPREIGALVPPAPARMMDQRPNRAQVIQSADVFVDSAGLIYCTDYNAGLYVMEFDG